MQRFLEPLESLGQRREGHAKAKMLALVPGSTDAEFAATLRKNIECRHDLGEQAGVAVGNAGDQQTQSQALGHASGEAERGITFEHGIVGSTGKFDLEVVIHQRKCADTDGFGSPSKVREPRSDPGGTARPIEPGYVKIEVHLRCPFETGVVG